MSPERRRMLDACASFCHEHYHGQDVDWAAVDRLDAQIAVVKSRDQLAMLLQVHEMAVVGISAKVMGIIEQWKDEL